MHIMTIRKLLLSVVHFALIVPVLMACSTSFETSPAVTGLSLDEPAEVQEEWMPVGTDGLLTYDESIPLTSYGKFEFFRDDLTELTETSDIVFIGRVTDYLEAVLTIQPPVEDP